MIDPGEIIDEIVFVIKEYENKLWIKIGTIMSFQFGLLITIIMCLLIK